MDGGAPTMGHSHVLEQEATHCRPQNTASHTIAHKARARSKRGTTPDRGESGSTMVFYNIVLPFPANTPWGPGFRP